MQMGCRSYFLILILLVCTNFQVFTYLSKLKNDQKFNKKQFQKSLMIILLLKFITKIGKLDQLINKNNISMSLNPFPFQKEILQQIVAEVGIVDQKQQDNLKVQLQKKYHKHVNLIQYHQLRQDRFVLSQQKILEKQHMSIQKTKQYIKLRQEKANYNKNHSIIEKSKRIESDLSRWEKIVEKNKKQHQKKLKQSLHLINQWNQKLSQSTSRKSMRLQNVSKTLQQKSNERSNKIQIHRQNVQEQQQSRIKNSQTEQIKKQNDSRYRSNVQDKRHSRISTESVHYRSIKNEQNLLQKSLIKNDQKNQRINEARYMKHYMLQKKNKLRQQKEENLRKIRQHRLSDLKHEIDERNEQLDQKFKNDRVKAKNKKSLPSVLGSKAGSFLFLNGPGEQWRSKRQSMPSQNSPSQKILDNHQVMPQKSREWSPSYDKLIVQKLRNVALLVRKGKKM